MATGGNSAATGGNFDALGTSPSTNNNSGVLERRCENAECAVVKLMAAVPKRKSTQFITEPNIKEKPLLINGFTTVFQVEGNSAKLMDLKNPTNPMVDPKPVYRIVPNTHAHIVNYVVVDGDGESLRKINEKDPGTMRKLLESQKGSAEQMLKKLMVDGNGNGNPTAAAPSTSQSQLTTPGKRTSGMLINKHPRIAPRPTGSPGVMTSVANSSIGKSSATSANIQLPLRMHPNLKITAVASADGVGALSVPNNSISPAAPTQMPLITPVPLSSLQNAPTANFGVSTDTGSKTNIDKMQQELEELRRTVAQLAEAQAQN